MGFNSGFKGLIKSLYTPDKVTVPLHKNGGPTMK